MHIHTNSPLDCSGLTPRISPTPGEEGPAGRLRRPEKEERRTLLRAFARPPREKDLEEWCQRVGPIGKFPEPVFGRGDDTIGNPHRAQIHQFELFELIVLSKLS